MPRCLFCCLLFALVLFWFGRGVAKTLHLHPVGTGTQHGNHYYGLWQIKSIAPGDIIYCYDDDGAYNSPFFLGGWKGTAEQPITIINASGEHPVIKGYIDIQDSQYIEIKGLTVTESPYGGILIQKGSHHITVARCIVKNNALGIWIANGAGMANRIMHNEVFSNATQGITADHVNCTSGNETILAENHVYDNGYHGFEISANYYIIEKNVVLIMAGTMPAQVVYIFLPSTLKKMQEIITSFVIISAITILNWMVLTVMVSSWINGVTIMKFITTSVTIMMVLA